VGASSFVHRTTAATAAAPAFPQGAMHVPATSSSTVLHMSLFDRFTRVVNSNLNNILKNLEDPEKIMTQALEDMQVRCIEVQFVVVKSASGDLSTESGSTPQPVP
jgi:PspA/IM30 family